MKAFFRKFWKVTKPDFLKKVLPKKGPKIRFFEVMEESSHYFFLHLVRTNFFWLTPIARKNLVCVIQAQPIRLQDFSINSISRTKWWNSLIFVHVSTNSWKFKVDLKFLVGCCQKWSWPHRSQKLRIGCISRKNWWNKLIFGMPLQIQQSYNGKFTRFLRYCSWRKKSRNIS